MSRDTRRFRVTDGMILIAALAVGLGLSRMMAPALDANSVRDTVAYLFGQESIRARVFMARHLIVLLVLPSLATLSTTCLVLHLSGPRPRLRRLVRQPGFVACLIVTAMVGLTLAAERMMREFPHDPSRPEDRDFPWVGTVIAGWAILWCWTTGLLGRSGRPARSWLDRLGRLLGSVWILLALYFGYVHTMLEPL